jgi:hypothetical protein
MPVQEGNLFFYANFTQLRGKPPETNELEFKMKRTCHGDNVAPGLKTLYNKNEPGPTGRLLRY